MRPQFFLAEIWTGLRRNATLTIAMVVNVAIALGLIGNAMLVREQADMIRNYFYGQLQVTIYLCGPTETQPCPEETTEAQRQQIIDDLDEMKPQVVSAWEYESQEDSYKRFQEYFKNQPTLLELTRPEQLPPTFRVELENPSDINVIVSAFQGRPGVSAVTDYSKILAGPLRFLDKLQVFAWGVGGVGLLAAILLILNSTLVAAHSRRRELGIMRLVGAPNYYIRLPFLVQSAIAALIGCALATATLFVEKALVLNPKLNGSLLISLPIVGTDEILGILPWLFILAILLAVVTSWISLIRYLRV